MRRLPLFHLLLALVAIIGCTDGSNDDLTYLTNNAGKADIVEIAVGVSAASPSARFGLICDAPGGCAGVIELTVRSPGGCELLGDCAMIPVARVGVAEATIRHGGGSDVLDVGAESVDGTTVQTTTTFEFTAGFDELVEVVLEHVAGAPDTTIALLAEWSDIMSSDGGADTGVGDDAAVRFDGFATDASPSGDTGPGDAAVLDAFFPDAPADSGPGTDAGAVTDAGVVDAGPDV